MSSFAVLGVGNTSEHAKCSGHPIPMTIDDDDTWALFPSHKDAKTAAEKHPFFRAVGYKIIEWPFSEPNTSSKEIV